MLARGASVDRRELLKILGSVGATASLTTACGTFDSRVSASTPTGGEFDKTIQLATAGPGGNKNWQPGDSLKFLPPEAIPTRGKASDLLAALPKERLLHFYDRMVTIRKWENAMKDLFLAGKDGLIGAFHSYAGEEAVAVGTIGALADDDFIASTHRGHGHLITKGGDLNKMSAEIFFKSTGYNKGYGGSMHITDMKKGILGMNGIVGASFYMAAGAALSAKARGSKQVAVAYFGDGAAASPYYFSAIRSCTNEKIPVIFVNENNFQYMGIAMALTVPTKYISEYTKGLDIPHFLVDGNDVSAVYAAAKEAVEWSRAGKGPCMIEAVTYRWYDHAGFAGGKIGKDGAMGMPYRTDEEVRQWISRDPVNRYRTWLLAKGLVAENDLTQIDSKAQGLVEASIEYARKSPDCNPEDGVLNTYAKSPALPTQFFNRSGLIRRTT